MSDADLTRDEFEKAYAARSSLTVEGLRALGRVVLPCRCGEEGCGGWQSISIELAADPLVRFLAGVGPPP